MENNNLDKILCDVCGYDITTYIKNNEYKIFHLCKDCMPYKLYIFEVNKK